MDNAMAVPDQVARVIGDAYETYLGRWSRQVGYEFVNWLALPQSLRWLDVGCGTGAFSQVILECCSPKQVIGVDPSEAYIAYARANLSDPRISFRIGNAQSLPVLEAEFDASGAAGVINFVPDTEQAVAEMRRATRPGGIVAVYVWDFAGGMNLAHYFWEAADEIDPEAVKLRKAVQSPSTMEALSDLFQGAGLDRIETRAIEVAINYKDFDDYWIAIASNSQTTGHYCQSLSEERRKALHERLRKLVLIHADGSIRYIIRAWAVRGLVPQ